MIRFILAAVIIAICSGCAVTSKTVVQYKAPTIPKLDFKRNLVPIYTPRLRLE
jgi:hypothetical protein